MRCLQPLGLHETILAQRRKGAKNSKFFAARICAAGIAEILARLAPAAQTTVARRFNAGKRSADGHVPEGRLNGQNQFSRPSGTECLLINEPGIKMPGYFQRSLRDQCPCMLAAREMWKIFDGRFQLRPDVVSQINSRCELVVPKFIRRTHKVGCSNLQSSGRINKENVRPSIRPNLHIY